MPNESNHLIDGLTVLGTVAVRPYGDADGVYVRCEPDGTAKVNDLTWHPGASSAPRFRVPAPPAPLPTNVITTAQSGHGWTLDASVSDDTSDFLLGTQSIRLGPTNGSGTSIAARRFALTSKDWTNLWPVVVLKAENMGNVQQLTVRLGDTSLANYYQWDISESTSQSGGYPWKRNNEWYVIPLLWAGSTTVGTPNRAAITDYQVRVNDVGGGTTTRVWFNGIWGISKHASYPNGVVTFSFDDNRTTVPTAAAPAMQKYGWAGTIYVIRDAVGTSGYATLTELQRLARAGWEMALHADTLTNHNLAFTSLSDAVLEQEIVQERSWLSQQFGPRAEIDIGAYPLGQYNDSTLGVLRRYCAAFRTIRGVYSTTTHWNTETLPPADPLRLRPVYVQQSTTLSQVQTWLTGVLQDAGWAHMVFHSIVTTPANNLEWASSDFTSLCDWLATNFPNTPVRPAGQVLRSL